MGAVKVDPGLGCEHVHSHQGEKINTQYVEWPEELTYTATSRGPFPFWDKGAQLPFGCETCDLDIKKVTGMKVMYSAKLKSENIMHEFCGQLKHWGAPDNSPCNHIFTPDEGAFIYTPKTALNPEADGKFCCRSVKKGSTMFTGAVPRDWMKSGEYKGIYNSFKGDHYSGPVKIFAGWLAHPFWYYTKPDGTPVSQGESCDDPQGKEPYQCDKYSPVTAWHEFVPGTFKSATFTSSDFAVPDVCKKTSVSCFIPGDNSEVIV